MYVYRVIFLVCFAIIFHVIHHRVETIALKAQYKLPISGKASGSKTGGYHDDGRQLSSSGSLRPGSWRGGCSPSPSRCLCCS